MTVLLELPAELQLVYVLCCLSILLVWRSHHIKVAEHVIPTAALSYMLMLLLAWQFGYIQPVAVLWIAVMLCAGVLYQRHIYTSLMLWVMLLLGFALATHSLPGFDNPLLIDKARISELSSPYTLWLSIDKFSAGLVIFYFVFSVKERSHLNLRGWLPVLPVIAITISVSILVALTGLLQFDFKLSPYLLLFAINNLLFTCMAEEAYFRGLVQKQLNKYLHYSIAIGISALLFGLAHYGAGRIDYVISAVIAGVGYAYVFHKTGSLSASMLTHWLLNLIHFIFFTYPFYQPA